MRPFPVMHRPLMFVATDRLPSLITTDHAWAYANLLERGDDTSPPRRVSCTIFKWHRTTPPLDHQCRSGAASVLRASARGLQG